MLRALYLAARLTADPTPATAVEACQAAPDASECVAWLEDWRTAHRGESGDPGQLGATSAVPRVSRAFGSGGACGR